MVTRFRIVEEIFGKKNIDIDIDIKEYEKKIVFMKQNFVK